MSIDVNDEIVQDFLVEAGELLEQLDQQLVTLESKPDDMEILNAVFRNFHTIKGGAGFLAIEPLVDICHQAENVFDMLRRGEQSVSANLMDAVLQAFDCVNSMFEQIGDGVSPEPVDEGLINRLKQFSTPGAATVTELPSQEAGGMPDQDDAAAVEAGVSAPATQERSGAAGDAGQQHSPAEHDEITEEEFEALLDDLHGKGKPAGVPQQETAATPASMDNDKPVPEAMAQTDPAPADDEITEDEFEAMLDDLQAKKQGAFVQAPVKSLSTEARDTAEHKAEKKPPADATVRVTTAILDRIMNMVGELVLLRNRLVNLDEEIGNEEMSSAVNNLDVVTADLQSSVMKTRMQPIKKVFGRFPRVVRDVARSLHKQVVLETMGEDTDLDKNLVEALTDPLIHLVRNAVDHGIEKPEVREAAGKPKQGTISLSAEQEGDHILLRISDDGAGMDANALRRKVVENGLMDADAAARLDDRECYHFIFLPGLSTKEEISDISGRGVGMDVVKSKINQLNGTILIDSTPGKGTTIFIKVPLTLAIMPTLMVSLGKMEQIFALPLVNVSEILDLDAHSINTVDGQQVLLVRGKPLPLFCINRWLTNESDENAGISGHVVVVSVGTSHIGLLVDKLLGREEVVIKPLGSLLHGTQGLAGATVTGNGKIALILDLPSLIQTYSHIRQ
ncbi:MAG: chemotaxis protein CheW [Gammaproteobacteria bacterium]